MPTVLRHIELFETFEHRCEQILKSSALHVPRSKIVPRFHLDLVNLCRLNSIGPRVDPLHVTFFVCDIQRASLYL